MCVCVRMHKKNRSFPYIGFFSDSSLAFPKRILKSCSLEDCELLKSDCIQSCLLRTYAAEFQRKDLNYVAVSRDNEDLNSRNKRIYRRRRDVGNAKGDFDQLRELNSDYGSQTNEDFDSGEVMDLTEILSPIREERVGVANIPELAENSYSTTEMPEYFDYLVDTEVPSELEKGSSAFKKSPRRMKFDESLEPFNLKDLAAASINFEPLETEAFEDSEESSGESYLEEQGAEVEGSGSMVQPEIPELQLIGNGRILFRGIEYNDNCYPVDLSSKGKKVATLYNCSRYFELLGSEEGIMDRPCWNGEVFDSDTGRCVLSDVCVEYPPCVELFAKDNPDIVRPENLDRFSN